ncbi:hypothetical protein M422DRAFT_37247, partial [Sphaerobolus stellatus SS14]
MNCTLVESARSMLRDASLPSSYWADAVEYAAHIRNVVPDVSRFRIFGCTAHVLIPESKRQKRCVDRSTGQVYESRDVVFDEGPQVPPERVTIDAKPPPRDDAQVEVEVDKDLPSLMTPFLQPKTPVPAEPVELQFETTTATTLCLLTRDFLTRSRG